MSSSKPGGIVNSFTIRILALIAAGVSTVAPAASTYTITNLGDLPGGYNTYALGLNATGQVVGYSGTDKGASAFLWSKSSGMADLSQGKDYSEANGINDDGAVVGVIDADYDDVGYNVYAYLWTESGGMVDLGELPGGSKNAVAWGINNHRQVVGFAQSATGDDRAFLWTENSGMRDIGDLPGGGNDSYASGINNVGQVIGWSSVGELGTHAFLWSSTGGMIDLRDLAGGSDYSFARGLNDAGYVVGNSSASTGWRAFLWSSSDGMTDLGELAGGIDGSFASDINNSGFITGSSMSAAGSRAVLWTPSGEIIDLNDLVDGDLGWVLTEASRINERGEIVGRGFFNGREGAFLLTPSAQAGVPEPATWGLMLLGLGAIGGTLRRTGTCPRRSY